MTSPNGTLCQHVERALRSLLLRMLRYRRYPIVTRAMCAAGRQKADQLGIITPRDHRDMVEYQWATIYWAMWDGGRKQCAVSQHRDVHGT